MVLGMCIEEGEERQNNPVVAKLAIFFLFSLFFIMLFSLGLIVPAYAIPSTTITITNVSTGTSGTSQLTADVSGDWIVWEDLGEG